MLDTSQKEINLLDNLPVGILLIDPEGNIKKSNIHALGMLCCSKQEIYSYSIHNFLEKAAENNLKHLINDLIAKSLDINLETKITCREGKSFWAKIQGKLIKEADKLSILISIVDFTQNKIKEELLKESEARFQNLANNAPVMIWIADIDGLFSFVNKFWLNFTGSEIGDELGMNWLRNVHQDDMDSLIRDYYSCFESRKIFSKEIRLKNHNNEFHWILLRGIPRMTPEGSFVGFIGTGTDITEQKENHERVIFLNKELSESIKTRDKFFSIIAHDIRSPLSGLIGITEILEEDFHEMNDREMLDMLTEANKSARSLFNLTENLLEWSRIQTGRIKFEPVKIYLRSLFHDLSLLYQQNLKYKNITLIYPTNTSILINADDRMTYTVIRNLISNAIKFTPQGGTITIDVAEENDFVKIFFRDTGVGMDENEMSKLFKVDSGFSLPGTENERGTGLGLVLCKDLVERQGGKIGVESVKGKGTVFYFTLQAFKE